MNSANSSAHPPLLPRWLHRVAAIAVAGVCLSFVASPARGADPFEENVRTTEPLTPEAQQKTFHLPPGFEIQLVAAEPDLRKPMNLAFDAQGRLWLTESREYPFPAQPGTVPRDTVRIFSDFAPTGRARQVRIFADQLNIPIGVYPYGDGAIAWGIPNIWFLHASDGQGVSGRREPLFGPFGWERDTHGNQASFRRGFDGWLYATHGYNNNSTVRGRDGHEVSMSSGNIYRLRLDGSRIEQHTHGQVNPFGLAWDSSGNLYSSDCHSAPTYQLLAGGYYPSFGKPHDGLGFAPVLMEHSHGSTAIDGMVYYSDDLWPEEFQNNTFLGNVMTSRINRDRLTFTGSSPHATELDDFVKCDDPWFRPVDNLLGPDGALYIADFYNRIIGHYEVPLQHPGRDRERGRIWRVVYTGKPLRPAALAPGVDGLLGELGSPSLTRRMLAQHELEDRHGTNAAPKLRLAARGVYDFPDRLAKTRAQVHASWALLNLNQLDDESLLGAAASGDSLLRVHAMRLLAETGRRLAGKVAGTPVPPQPDSVRAVLHRHLGDPDALVARCAADALSVWPAFANLRPLLDTLARANRADTHLVYVLRQSLRDQLHERAVFEQVLAQTWHEADERALADVVVAVASPEAGAFLLRFAQKYPVERTVLAEYLKHAARYAPAEGLETLAQFARAKFADDPDFQLALFQSVQQGLEQRGTPLPPGVKAWGAALGEQLLAAADGSALAWSNTPLEGAARAANPWFVQPRASADGGQASPFLCSLPPGGESLTGVLRSQPFAVPARLNFFLAGHDGYPDKPAQKKNVVRLRAVATQAVLAEAFPPRNDTAQAIHWDLSAHVGESARLEITDADTGDAYAWLAVGRFEPAVVTVPALSPNAVGQRARAAADLIRTLPLPQLAPALARLLANPTLEPEAAGALARALVTLQPEENLAALAVIAGDAAAPDNLRRMICTAIAGGQRAAAPGILLEVFRAAPRRVQVKLAEALATTAAGTERLFQLTADGHAPATLLVERLVKDKLLAAKSPAVTGRWTQLTKGLAPASAEIQKLIDTRRAEHQPTTASATKGEAVFTQNCRVCHQLDGVGNVVGPQLDGIGNRGLERLLEDVLDPNRNVDRAFRTTLLTLKDGEVTSGLFRREEGEMVVLAEATGKEISVPKKQIQSRDESETSLMPANFGELIAPADFNDLVAYLLSKRGQPAR